MRSQSYGGIAVLAAAMVLTATGTSHAQGGNKGLFTNEQRTLACQQYINALYPATTGQMDRQRESAYKACLRMKPKKGS
jgi:hypothetical protein